MCQVTSWCICVPLRVGCIFGSLLEFILIFIESILGSVYIRENKIDSKALIASRAIVIILCSVLLFVGALKRDRICAILHALFLGAALFTEVVFEIFVFNISFIQSYPDWLTCYIILNRAYYLYMVFVSTSLALRIKIRDNRTIYEEPYRQRLMSSAISSEIYGV